MPFKRTLPDPEPKDCRHCGKTFMPERKSRPRAFCSLPCQRAACMRPKELNGELSRQSAQKRGDMQRGDGEGKTYRKRSGMHEHRYVMEAKIGRPLLPGEVVHHRDGDYRNNDPDNLELLPSQSEHMRVHLPELMAARWPKA